MFIAIARFGNEGKTGALALVMAEQTYTNWLQSTLADLNNFANFSQFVAC